MKQKTFYVMIDMFDKWCQMQGIVFHLYADAAESGKIKVHEEERMQKMWEYKRIGKRTARPGWQQVR